ncbi:MAG: hypothetical protein Q8Q09_10865 [Deltaproteobacteria bacterium]|nr:hypothetical protein [Deltaproteobacteria bacterium]
MSNGKNEWHHRFKLMATQGTGIWRTDRHQRNDLAMVAIGAHPHMDAPPDVTRACPQAHTIHLTTTIQRIPFILGKRL